MYMCVTEQIARVAVGLCQSKPDLADIIKAEFYRLCPLTVPRQPEAGLSRDDLLENMGFKRLPGGGDAWEDKDAWSKRMNNLLCTYTVLMLQPEQSPLSLEDAWAWLANMVNACSRIAKPHFFTGDALDIFLHVAAPALVRVYGNTFLQLLSVIQKDIVPKLEDGPSFTRLKAFLDEAVRSGGRKLPPFFVKS
jgi:GLE1-like protein